MASPKSINMSKVGLFGWDDTNNRWQALSIDSSGNLNIAATINVSDIQIGAVELKDGDSDTRADIESDGTNNAIFIKVNKMVPDNYDYIDLGYTDSDLTSVIFKRGGSGGTTVATLVLTYDSGKLDTITKT